MNENTNTNTTETPAADWDDWDGIDFSDTADDADAPAGEDNERADQMPETEPGEADTNEAAEDAAAEGADQTFTLKHLDETRDVSREEVIELAQKGMDYDRIRQRLDEVTTERDRLSAGAEDAAEAVEFLGEMAQRENLSVRELIDRVRAEALAKSEGIDISVALGKIQNRRERAALDKERSAMQSGSAANEARQQAIIEFAEAYPDVDAKSIPKAVWDEFNRTGSLLQAYRAEENRQLREELAGLRQTMAAMETNRKNKGRSTGSQKTYGQERELDPITADWYGGK